LIPGSKVGIFLDRTSVGQFSEILTKEEILTRFEDYLRYERRYSDHTLESYCRDASQYMQYLEIQYTISDVAVVTHHHIRSWIVSLLKSGQQPVTVKRKVSALTHLYKWLRRMKIVSTNPVLKIQLPKSPERLPKSIPQKVMSQLWQSLEKEDMDYSSQRDKTLLSLLYGSGMRRSELISVTWGDYDPARQTLKVLGKGRKHRQIPVNPMLAYELKKLKKCIPFEGGSDGHMPIILMDNGKPCYPKYVHNKVVGMLSTVTTADKKSPHVLRHSMATHLMDQGAELNAVKGILGHASLAATQVYTHNSITRLKEIYQQAHPKSNKD
jgi:integrase/recombinase XerC